KEEQVLAPPLAEPAQLDLETAEAERGEIIKRVRGAGNMVSSTLHDLYYTRDGGRLKELMVSEGANVSKGDVLVEIDTGNLVQDIQQLNLDLKIAELRLQQMTSQGADKYAIEIGKLQIQYIAINEDDLKEVTSGMEAIITVQGEEVTGEVVQTPKDIPTDLFQENPELYSKSLLIGSDELSEELSVGDIAEIEIITAKKEDALIIPKNGLRTTGGRDFVQVAIDNTKREIDIEVGIVSSTEVEVTKGLEEGDSIILK